MSFSFLDRRRLRLRPLSERRNRVQFPRDAVDPSAAPRGLTPQAGAMLPEVVDRVRAARAAGKPVMCAFGAHTIKNGLGPVLIRLIRDGWITHLATNGAGIIHDWELAYQGSTSEDVRENVGRGEFGAWEETGRFINIALLVGRVERPGLRAVGGRAHREPGPRSAVVAGAQRTRSPRLLDAEPDRAAAAADLLSAMREFGLPAGRLQVPHPFAELQRAGRGLVRRRPLHRPSHDRPRHHLRASPEQRGGRGPHRAHRLPRVCGGREQAGRRRVPVHRLRGHVADDLREVPLHGAEHRPAARAHDRESLHPRRGHRGIRLGLDEGRRAADHGPRLLPALLQDILAAWAARCGTCRPTTATSCCPWHAPCSA